MADGVTNRGRKRINGGFFQRDNLPDSFYLALCTAEEEPNLETNTMADLVEIDAGNGYDEGGLEIAADDVGFLGLTEDDINDRSDLRVSDQEWIADGGPLPASGDPARWAVLTDDNPDVASRDVIAWFDLDADVEKDDGESLIVAGCKLRVMLPKE